jgi:hypothetical protein
LDCVSLETIDFDGGLQTIGEKAFSGCISLKTEALSALVNTDGPLALGDYAFAGCTALTNLVQANIGTIGLSVFQDCVNLASVTISAESIGERAFQNCVNLSSVVIQNTVTEIRRWAFYGCTSLGSVTISNSVEEIGVGAFQNCTSLVSIAIPDSVTTLGEGAFRSCTGLETVSIPNSLTSLPQRLFDSCAGLASVSIPDSIRTIGRYAFDGCASLESITIPATVESVAEYAFANCTNLTVTVLDFSTNIGTGAFSNCAGVVYPESVEEGLVDGVWLDREITEAGEKQYYRFPVTAGLRYGVWVNDNGSFFGSTGGDGTKTLDIGITATYEGSTTPIFEPGIYLTSDWCRETRYVLPQLFTAASEGIVILEAAKHSNSANDTGTFAIKYGEVKPLEENTMVTGTLAAERAQWYAFFPTPSTTYAVSWEDAGDQAAGSSYTGDVVVTAFQTIRDTTSDAKPNDVGAAFTEDSGYSAQHTLLSNNKSNANRLQLIRVEATTAGTYSIKYQEQ